jgi:exodeoxyribonuclease-3
MFKLTSLNLNGIRSAASKGLQEWLAQSLPDCICVQELKAQAADISGRFEEIAGLKGYFHCAEKKGYSGVGIYSRHEPSDVIAGYGSPEFDAEGRYVELRFDRPGRPLSLISCYFPSGSSGEERQAAKFRFLAGIRPHLANLKNNGGQAREFILCGDINIAHQEIDLKNFKGNRKNSGFLPEERAWMTQLLQGAEAAQQAAETPAQNTTAESADSASSDGLVDVYRQLHPATTGEAYTWWSNRGQAYAKNVGWRLDYQIATPTLAAGARSASIHREPRFSDHAPLTIDYDWAL